MVPPNGSASHQPCHVPMSHGVSQACPFCNCLICRCSTGRTQEPGLLQGKTNSRSNNQYRTLHLQKGPMAMCLSVSWLPRLQGSTRPAGPDSRQHPHPTWPVWMPSNPLHRWGQILGWPFLSRSPGTKKTFHYFFFLLSAFIPLYCLLDD